MDSSDFSRVGFGRGQDAVSCSHWRELWAFLQCCAFVECWSLNWWASCELHCCPRKLHLWGTRHRGTFECSSKTGLGLCCRRRIRRWRSVGGLAELQVACVWPRGVFVFVRSGLSGAWSAEWEPHCWKNLLQGMKCDSIFLNINLSCKFLIVWSSIDVCWICEILSPTLFFNLVVNGRSDTTKRKSSKNQCRPASWILVGIRTKNSGLEWSRTPSRSPRSSRKAMKFSRIPMRSNLHEKICPFSDA